MLRVTATKESVDSITSLINFLANLPNRVGPRQKRSIRDGVVRGFQYNFTHQAEGDGAPWASLAPMTRAQRKKLGYAEARPILVRSGEYRSSFVDLDNPSHFSEEGALPGGGLYFEEASEDWRVSILEPGIDEPVEIPPRPVTILSNESEDRLGSIIDFIWQQLDSQYVR